MPSQLSDNPFLNQADYIEMLSELLPNLDCFVLCAEKNGPICGPLTVELAGLEPATSWVRFRWRYPSDGCRQPVGIQNPDLVEPHGRLPRIRAIGGTGGMVKVRHLGVGAPAQTAATGRSRTVMRPPR